MELSLFLKTKLSLLVLLVVMTEVKGCSDESGNLCPRMALIGRCNDPEVRNKCHLSCGICTCRDALGAGHCAALEAKGECITNSDDMKYNCKATCGHCECKDSNTPECLLHASQGKCLTDASVRQTCPLSCGYCGGSCGDNFGGCEQKAMGGECHTNSAEMLINCPQSCGTCECINSPGIEALCSQKAKDGECESNPKFMFPHCPENCPNMICQTAVGYASEGYTSGYEYHNNMRNPNHRPNYNGNRFQYYD